MSNTDTVTGKAKPSLLFVPLDDKYVKWAEWFTIISFCAIPLFVKFPFRINLFLAWEGAYRLAEGQIPFRDFGMPLGYGFWILPAFFFKLLGPQMITLVKAQAVINVLTFVSFRSILKTLGVKTAKRFIVLLVLGLSYVLVNFWPWYNNMVFVYELLAIQALLLGCYRFTSWKAHLLVTVSSFFIVLAIFTKQDGGGLTLILASVLLLIYVYRNRRWSLFFTYAVSGLFWGAIYVLPLISYDFTYWFNFGQLPHYSRINVYDFLEDIFGNSFSIKLYISLIALALIQRFRNWDSFWQEEFIIMLSVLSLGILGQALLIQVTSYIPHNVNVYFHSFAIAALLCIAGGSITWSRPPTLLLAMSLVFLSFSSDYWLYANRIFRKFLPKQESEGVISKGTWSESDSTVRISRSNWVESDYWVFEDIYLPEETIQGIKNIESLDIVKQQGKNLRVLNMSELTPLAHILGYTPESGVDYPLWFHYGVSMFDREVAMFCQKVESQEYDLILFETIPNLNNFYPAQVRDCIRQSYRMTDRFLAPRVKHNSHIEVYVRD